MMIEQERTQEVGEDIELPKPSEADFARVVKKICLLNNWQLTWAIHQMRHLGFSPCDEKSLRPTQQSK